MLTFVDHTKLDTRRTAGTPLNENHRPFGASCYMAIFGFGVLLKSLPLVTHIDKETAVKF